MINIRKAKFEDIPFIIKKGNQVFNDSSPGFYMIRPYIVCRYLENEPEGQFVAENMNRETVGFLITGSDWRKEYQKTLWLFWEWVDENYRNRGVASELLKHAVKHAKKMGYKFLVSDVDKNNSAAMELLKKFGFSIDAETIYFKKPL